VKPLFFRLTHPIPVQTHEEDAMPLHPTKNDLPARTRSAMTELLNARLADAIDLSLQLKHAHWNVRGSTFLQLHELFDKLHAEVLVHVDDLAERCAQLGATAQGLLPAVARGSSLPAYPVNARTPVAHLRGVQESLAAFAKSVRAAINTADEAGDKDTADLFTGISRGADKALWFVEAHLG